MALHDIKTGTALTPAGETRLTESTKADFRDLHEKSNVEILTGYMQVQHDAVEAARAAIGDIAGAADQAIARLTSQGRDQPKGRIVYVGAGTSGRLGALDGMELGPTFNFPDANILFRQAEPPEIKTGTHREGLEDKRDLGTERAIADHLGPNDVIIALAASGTTPYTLAYSEEAKKAGALVIGIANNPGSPLMQLADAPICVATGPEAIRGSSRMGAGTAQKAALTSLTSLIMAKLPGIHGVYKGEMVNMAARNEKLWGRMTGMVTNITECTPEAAKAAIAEAKGDIKAAILHIDGASVEEANGLLTQTDNDLGAARASLRKRITPEAIRTDRETQAEISR